VKSILLNAVAIGAILSSGAQAQTPTTGPDTSTTQEEEAPAEEGASNGEVAGEEITVTASRTQTAVSDVPASISILSGQRLQEQLNVSVDLNDVLSKAVPGLVANNERGFSNGTGPLLRGRPASVLINGVPVNQLQRSSGFDLGLIDPLAIDRIEVNRGASAVFGFGASGGVINAITRRARSNTPTLMARTQVGFSPNGDFSDGLTVKGYASGGVKLDNGMDFYIGGGFSRAGSAINPDGYAIDDNQLAHIYNLDGNVGYEWANGSAIRASGNFFRRNFRKDFRSVGYMFGYCANDDCTEGGVAGNLDPLSTRNSPEQNVDDQWQQNYVASINYSNPNVLGSLLDITAYTQRNTFHYQDNSSDFDGNPPTISYQINDQDNRRYGFRSNLTSTFKLGGGSLALTYGLDFLRDEFFRSFAQACGSDTLPLTFSPTPQVTRYLSTVCEVRPLAPPVNVTSYAGFLQGKFEAGPLIFQAGVRREEFRPRSRGYVVKDRFGPGLDLIYLKGKMPKFHANLFNAGIVYSFTQDSEVFAGLSQGLEITQIGRAFRGLGGLNSPADPKLVNAQPAKTTQYELGVRARFNQLRLTASGYYSDAPLSSQTVQISPFEPLVPLRRPERIWGFEATADYNLSSRLSTGAVFTYQFGEYENDDGDEFDMENDRVTPTRVTAFVNYAPQGGPRLRLQGTRVFDRAQFDDNPTILFGAGGPGNVDSYFVLDALATFPIGSGELTAGVENLLNNRYVVAEKQGFNDAFDYGPAEGARITFGYQMKF
jgi:iron complex outermembrane receptor protein